MDLFQTGSRLNPTSLVLVLSWWCSALIFLVPFMQDMKPRFHSSRFHGSEDVEDEVCLFYSSFVLIWTRATHFYSITMLDLILVPCGSFGFIIESVVHLYVLFFSIAGWWHCKCLELTKMQCSCIGFSLKCVWGWHFANFDAHRAGF